MLRACAARIEAAGGACHTAECYEQALSTLDRERRVRLVVTDHGVSGDDTARFVELLRACRPGVVVVGSSGRDCREEFAALGVDRFLKKPWLLRDLTKLLLGRIDRCTSCRAMLPLRLPFARERGESFVCRQCGARYRAMLDRDAPEYALGNVERV